jgi:hypothetical protein
MSRHWHRVSKPIQTLAVALYPIMSEGMSPYEMYYVLATDEEIQLLNELSATTVVH